MSETEIKLHVEAGRRGRLLDALGHRRLRQSALSAIYFDTPDLLLSRHRFALRLRNEDGRWVQTLKGGKGGKGAGAERFEHEVAVDPDGAGAGAGVPQLDLDRHRDSEVGRRLRALLRRHEHPSLGESCRTEVTRLRRLLRARGAVVEWALDEGELKAAGRSQPISELELELKSGDPASLYALAHDWEALHGLWVDPVSKSERGALLAEGEPFRPAVKAGRPGWNARQARAMDGQMLLRHMVASCVAQILPNAAEIARGSRDPEHVHQLRVGLRRLRSVVRGMQPFAAQLPPAWEAAIMPVFEALGDARDKHVRSTTLAPKLRAAGAPLADLGESSEEETKTIQQLVRGGAFQGVVLRLMHYAQATGGDAARGKPGSGLAHLVRRLGKLERQVTRDARRFDKLPFDQRHKVRKRLKRLRYLAEFAAPAFDGDHVKAWMDKVSPAQDRLGKHIDLALAAERFAAVAATDPDAAFAAEWLRAKSESSTRAARKSLERLRRAKTFW
ncbi:MAG: CHAD domain-containing protein [Vitreoscilla sp.]